VHDKLVSQIGGLIDDNLAVLETRDKELTRQLDELHSLRGKNADVIMHLMSKSREEQAAYLRNVESFQNSRRLLQNQATSMLEALSIDTLDRLINHTRESMTHSWSTAGMKRGMETFFDGARDSMEQVSSHAEQTRMLIRATYRKFHEEHGLPQIMPKQFSIAPYSTELERLCQEADAFRRSPVTTMTQQSFVIKKFFISLVSHTRSLFYKANQDADNWLKEVMTPLVKQIKEHKISMERRLETLRRISDSRDTLDARINELNANLQNNRQQLDTLQQIQQTINTPLPGTIVATPGVEDKLEALV
jgi:wobble nucleotide-excising tRNase